MEVKVLSSADLGAGEPAQRVQKDLQRAGGHPLEPLFRIGLHDVVDVQQDLVQVHTLNGLR